MAYWTLTEDFEVGDLVQQFTHTRSALTPYVGEVLGIELDSDSVSVRWPFGVDKVASKDLVRLNSALQVHFPQTLACSKTSSSWGEPHPGFHHSLGLLYHVGASPVAAYDALWHQYRQVSDKDIRGEIGRFYSLSENLVTAFLSEHATKTAAYWASRDRKYRATKSELESRSVTCPKCKSATMRKATYKMENGCLTKLLACPGCMYLLKQSDLLGPDGNGVDW